MRSKAACLFFFVVVLISAVPASWATWSGPKGTGTATGIGSPSCAQVSTNKVACAVLTEKASIMVNEYNGSAWSTWKVLTGAAASSPSCTSDGDGKVICAATASTGSMLVTIFNGSAWSTPTDVTAALYSAPSCAEYTSGKVLCVARNASGGLAWSLYSGTAWSTFANISTTTVSGPACTSDHNSGVVCAVYTAGGVTLVDKFVGGSWKGLLNIGGQAEASPDCTFWKSNGEVACFAKGQSSEVYITTYNGGTWSVSNWESYQGLGGIVNDNASCTSQATGDLVCGAIGPDGGNLFYGNTYNGAAWSGWVTTSTKGFGSPSCAPLTTGKAVCLVTGFNNELSSIVGP